jgi:hypothetical protein
MKLRYQRNRQWRSMMSNAPYSLDNRLNDDGKIVGLMRRPRFTA